MAENVAEQPLPQDQAPRVPAGTIAAHPDDRLRLTTAEREEAEAMLGDAVDLGAIDLDEYGQRYRSLLEARTRGDIRRLVHDLPGAALFGDDAPAAARSTAAPSREAVEEARRWYVAVMGDNEAKGHWRPTTNTTALAVMGSAKIDLREALRPGDDIAVDAIAVMGEVEVVVLPGTDVQMSGFAIMGDRTLKLDEHAERLGQRVRLNATAVMGDVKVRSRPLGDPPTRRERRTGKKVGASAGASGATRQDAPAARGRGIAGPLALVAMLAALVAAGTGALPAGVSVLGSSTVQVSPTQLADGPVTVDAYTLMGSTTVVVPDGTQVQMGGISILGSNECAACSAAQDPDAPLVRVRGVRVLGSVNVETPTTNR